MAPSLMHTLPKKNYSTDIVLAKGISSRISQLDDMHTLAQQLLRQIELQMIDTVSQRLTEMANGSTTSSASRSTENNQVVHSSNSANGFIKKPKYPESLETLRERSAELKKFIAIIDEAKADWTAWVTETEIVSMKDIVSCWLQMPLKFFGDTLTGLL